MEVFYILYDYFIIAGAIQGVFLSIILFSIKNGNKKANLFLCLLLISFSFSIFHIELVYILHLDFPSTTRIGEPFQLLFGPLFYFYIKYLTDSSYKVSLNIIYHFIPTLLFFPLYFFYKNLIIIFNINLKIFNIVLWMLFVTQMMIYLFVISRRLLQHRKNIKNEFSNIDEINLNWIWYVIHCLILFYSLYILLIPILIHFPNPYSHFNKIVMIMISFLIYGIGYRGLIQPVIFSGNLNKIEPDINNKKYLKSLLDANKINDDFLRLKKLMDEKKIYKNIDLKLSDLSSELKTTNHNLSQVINIKTGNNFYDFINSYRIEEIKKLLSKPENIRRYTILSLAYDAGFNSKATFNKFFKKVTGLTPTDYIKANS